MEDTSLNQTPQQPSSGEWKMPPVDPVGSPPVAQPAPVLGQAEKPVSENSVNPVPSAPVAQTPIMPNLPQKSGVGKKIMLALSVVVALLIVAVGFVFADDKGLLTTGISAKLSFIPISSLWGGLSANPNYAAAQTARAMLDQHAFAYSGTIEQTVTNATATNATCETAPVSAACSSQLVNKQGTFLFQSALTNYAITLTINDGGVPLQTAYRAISGDLYAQGGLGAAVSGSNSSADQWIKSPNAPDIRFDATRDHIISRVSDASFIGSEKVNSENTYHFKFAAQGADFAILKVLADKQLPDWSTANGSLDIWISRTTHLPLKLEMTLTRSGTATLHIVAIDNQAQRTQAILVPDSVIDSTTPTTPDSVRKQDLKTIAKALDAYHTARGSLPIANVAMRLDQADTTFLGALVPTYITALPKDPADTRYYAYTSDGATYELSAVLDDATDPEGTKSGSKTFYIVKGPGSSVDNGASAQ